MVPAEKNSSKALWFIIGTLSSLIRTNAGFWASLCSMSQPKSSSRRLVRSVRSSSLKTRGCSTCLTIPTSGVRPVGLLQSVQFEYRTIAEYFREAGRMREENHEYVLLSLKHGVLFDRIVIRSPDTIAVLVLTDILRWYEKGNSIAEHPKFLNNRLERDGG